MNTRYYSTPSRADYRSHHFMSLSDRIFARLSLGGRVIAEIDRADFPSLSFLLTAIRAMVPGVSGLARLSVRNMSRGWSLERPLMLRASEVQPVVRAPYHWEVH